MLTLLSYYSKFFFFISFYNWILTIYCFIWIHITLVFLFTQNVRQKFILILINLFFFIMWGFYYNLDGIMLLLCLSELFIIFTFFLLYTQINTTKLINKNKINIKISLLFLLLFLILINFTSFDYQFDYQHINYYIQLNWIVSADFFFIYVFFFFKLPHTCYINFYFIRNIFYIFYFFILYIEGPNTK